MKTKTGKFTHTAVIFAVILMIGALLAGCGEDKAPVELDIDAVAKSIHEGVEFEDTLAPIDSEAVKYLYDLGELENTVQSAVYVGSGATAEEIAVFDAGSDEAGETLETIVRKHVEDQIESYRNYVPAELSRLEKAVIIREGRYVMLCVAADDAAAKGLMEDAIGG